MDYLFYYLATVVLVISWLLLSRKRNVHQNLPPGPKGLPLFGYFPFLTPRRYVTLAELTKRYGDVMMLPLFTTNVLILGSFDAVQEAFINQDDVFSARPKFRFIQSFMGDNGIILTDGDKWQEHRRFALRTLRDFGFGKSLSLAAIHQEVGSLVAHIDQEGTKGLDTAALFSKVTANVICSLVFGDRVASEDMEFPKVKQTLDDLVECDSLLFENIPIYFPRVMDIPFFMRIYNKFASRELLIRRLMSYIERKVAERASSIDLAAEPRDFTDAILLHRLALEAQERKTHTFDMGSIAGDVFDLFAAGTDTTAVTLSWACLLLATHPEVKFLVRKEVLEVVGCERLVTMQDRPQLNYTLAVLDEVARFASIAPTAIPHRTLRSTTLKGYFIPAGTPVIANTYGVHMDAEIWKNPLQFDPGHFLDERGVYRPSAKLIPFSLGKRACLGESLARMELFVFFVSINQRYDVSVGNSVADMEELLKGNNGLVRHLDKHQIIFKRLD